MTATHHPDKLDQLRAELAAQRAVTAAQQVRLARLERRRRHPRRTLPILLAALLAALIPLATLAANPFTDLNPGSVHNFNIDAIYTAGITTGCNPGVAYCPTNPVTRQEMASFLARTAGLGTNKPVANAARLATTNPAAGGATYAANDLVRTARTAASRYTRDQDPADPTNTELALTTTFGAIETLSLTAPTSGFVIITATVGMSIEGTGTVGLVRVSDGVTTSPTLTAATNSGPNPTTAVATTLSPTYVFPVTAGLRTFTLEGQKLGLNGVTVYDGIITAIFVPFGAGGVAGQEGE